MFVVANFQDHGTRIMWAVARLSDHATVEAAAAELRTIGAQVAAAYPATNARFAFNAAALSSQYFVDARQPLWYLLGGSLFVLLIGCANVANLLLVRSSGRAREFAVRQALGASTGQVMRQLLVEGLVLAGAGAGAGLVLAAWLTPVLVRISGIAIPAYAAVEIDGPVLAMTAVSAIACGLLFGLAPLWRTRRIHVREAIGSNRVARTSRVARVLAAVEIVAAFVLAAGALLILQSFASLTKTDLLFRTDRFLTARFELPQDRYPTPALRAQAGRQLLERAGTIAGVESATIWGPSMFGRSTWVAFLSPADRVVADNERLMVWRHSTNPGALRDLGIRLVGGRDIAATDTLDTPPVAIVSEATARALWPGQEALGRQLRVGTAAAPVTIVGVAADARHRGRFRFSLGAAAHEPQLDIYFPYAQRPNALISVGVRTAGAAENYTQALRSAIAAFDPTVAVYDVATLDSRMRDEETPVAFAAVLLNAYGVLAIVLAAIGIYGVLAAAVAGRTREFGIRTALGADARRLLTSVVGEGLGIALVGIAIGSAIAWWLSRSFRPLLFGVGASTAATLAGAALLLAAIAIVASVLPARRAAAVDPVAALRAD
jgi:predicted permease